MMQVQSLASLSGLRIPHELWYRSQMWLGSCITVSVAQAGSCSFDSTLSLGTAICHGYSPKKQKKKKRKINESFILFSVAYTEFCLLNGYFSSTMVWYQKSILWLGCYHCCRVLFCFPKDYGKKSKIPLLEVGMGVEKSWQRRD